MAVVNNNSTLFRDAQAGGAVPDALQVKGVVRRATGTVTNAADDSTLSTYKLITLPSWVILGPGTLFHVENWGFAAIRIGTFTDVDALVSVLKSAATSQAPVSGIAATAGERLWETLGLAEDPNTEIGLYAHAIAGATGAGAMPFTIEWIDNV